ncbi:MAG: rane fusion protein multidrug efflux system [Alphaproteobacteria bacterium]|jgi:RND family efflux transporter MFP subunit|nr:rane fusion protein multidrug efflux system [Alphaproteobacteria bacterium]
MKKRTLIFVAAATLVVAGGVWFSRGSSSPQGAAAQSQRGPQRGNVPGETVPVELGVAVKKKVPIRIEALGTVTPMASVAIKTRIDTEIIAVHFADGAVVQKGDLLFTLDSRALEAQLRQLQGTLAKDRASLEGSERDVKRYSELLAKGATTQLNLDNATTQANSLRGTIAADESAIENLKVQISYCTIHAPISGRASMAAVKVGNLVRAADPTPLATLIQSAPVYITFPLPQRSLPDLRQGLAAGSATIEASVPGESRRAAGQVTMIENTVDATTGTVPVRATMPNADELLWPGTLVTVRLTFREEDAITVPSTAVQVSQSGSFVFVVKNNVATVQPITVARVLEMETVLTSGLEGGESVVTNGQLRLSNGSRVAARDAKTGT